MLAEAISQDDREQLCTLLRAAHNEGGMDILNVLDEQGILRKHVVVFVNGEQVVDRVDLSDPVPEGAEVRVMQALSGG